MKGHLKPANLVTSANLASGFVALVLASHGELAWAVGCVVAAAGLDGIDGLLARRCDDESDFGAHLDSLADLVSFGAAPAFMLYVGVLEDVLVAGIAACLGFVMCGAWRLARFPLVVNTRRRFVGLPIPTAGVVGAVLAAASPSDGLALAVTLGLAVLMITTLPFPTQSEIARLGRPPRRVEAEETTGGSRLARRSPLAARVGGGRGRARWRGRLLPRRGHHHRSAAAGRPDQLD